MSARDSILELKERMGRSIIGQEHIVERLIIGLLANGNLLVEGLPGLAKTRAVESLAKNLEAEMSRIQFTPDLLPSDITGTEVYHQIDGKGEFRFEPGPIFSNVVLADEINRAPAKVQAALLEAMEERTVTVAGTTHEMSPLFMVMATQNPIEQEGTYPLPEAQMDRFLMHVYIDYPDPESEIQVLRLDGGVAGMNFAFLASVALASLLGSLSFVDLWWTADQQGRRAFERGDFVEAAERFEDPMWRGGACYRAEDWDCALGQFARLETPEAYFNLANTYAQRGDLELAVAAYDRALELRSDWPEANGNRSLVIGLIPAPEEEDEGEQGPPQDPHFKPEEGP